MAAPRKKKRKYGRNDARDLFSFARQFTLAPIASASDFAAGAVLVEPAWDGHRMLATRVDADTRLAALDYREWAKTFPRIASALTRLAPQKLALDGVVCALDDRGVPSFDKLRESVAKGFVTSAVMIC